MKQKLPLLLIALFFNLLIFSQVPTSSIIDQTIDCTTGCSDLVVNFLETNETTDYTVESIPFNPPIWFNGLSNQISMNVDDLWSPEVNLPFDFCFYGSTYNQLIAGGNGVLSFNTENANSNNGWQFVETLPNNTNPTLSQANIFAAGHDLDASVSTTDELGFQIIGEAPFRAFVLSYFEVPHFQCNTLLSTQMVILYETTNIIDIFILNKPLCETWNSGNAVIGIQNPEGTAAAVPPGRNTGQWQVANEAWRFNPSGTSSLNTFAWYDNVGTLISNDPSINVCPTTTETYTVEVGFLNTCTNENGVATQSITVTESIIGEDPSDIEICSSMEFEVFDLTIQTDIITGGSTCTTVTYYETLTDAENDTNPIAQPEAYTNISNPQTIFVRVEDIESGSFDTTEFDILISSSPEIFPSELVTCSFTPGFADFDLQLMDVNVTGGNPDYLVKYYRTIADAENQTNELVGVYINEDPFVQTIIARVDDQTSSCYSLIECFLNAIDGGPLQTVTLFQCDDESNDGISEFNLAAVIPEITGGNPDITVTFYESEADAQNGINQIATPESYTNTTNPQAIFVRGENVFEGCLSFGIIELFVEESPSIDAPTPLTVCDFDGTLDGFSIFDLETKNIEILGGLDPSSFFVSYHETQEDADANLNPLNQSGYFNIVANFQTVFVRVENQFAGCFDSTILDLIVDVDCPIACEENGSFCYANNDTNQYSFTSDNGAPVTLFINSGQVENDFDEFIVLDSDGVTNLNGSPYGNEGDLTGLTFVSSGDTITFFVQSDGSINCQDNDFTPINYSIFCLDANGIIDVSAFVDENLNGIFDDTEINFNDGVFTYVVNDDGIINYVNSSYGSFIIPILEEGDSYDISFTMFDGYESCLSQPFTLIEDVTAVLNETVHVDFPVTPITDCSDIAVSLLSYIPPRPGLTDYNNLVIENLGSLPVSGSVEFTHDDALSLLDVQDVDAGNSITNTATGFILNFNDLGPGEQEVVTIRLNVPVSAMAGDIITNSAVYSVSDINLDNNESVLTEIVINSYDPNNKVESHGPQIKLDDFSDDDYLFYTINFQNLGTAEAIDIRVEDMLDAQLDVSTFKMLTASHDFVLTRIGHSLTWEFEDINLPSESMDEPNSHGFVYFKIQPLVGYAEGDIIPNFADIYFDFNPAITTNTFETEFVEVLSVDEFYSTSFSMYPNPANSLVNVQFNYNVNENISVGIYDIQGKLIIKLNEEMDNNEFQLDVSKLSHGMYFVELKGNNFKMVEKLIKE